MRLQRILVAGVLLGVAALLALSMPSDAQACGYGVTSFGVASFVPFGVPVAPAYVVPTYVPAAVPLGVPVAPAYAPLGLATGGVGVTALEAPPLYAQGLVAPLGVPVGGYGVNTLAVGGYGVNTLAINTFATHAFRTREVVRIREVRDPVVIRQKEVVIREAPRPPVTTTVTRTRTVTR